MICLLRTSRVLVCFVGLSMASIAWGVDFESFEFNDAPGTALAGAANTASPGNQWLEDEGMSPSRMEPSDVRGGVYNVVTMQEALVSNFLDIDNVTSGTVYLTALMSGWHFVSFEGQANEQFRLAFLNDDDADFGNTLTAQMQIGRNANGDIELTGSALGSGATAVADSAILNNTQAAPFRMTLELNKATNTYKVFYKDGTNPSQTLGSGAVAPTRDGNSLRLAVNNIFGDGSFDYPIFIDEFFAVDRIALTDVNPHNDLISLEVDRSTGALTLRNNSGAAIAGLESYAISSAAGGLDPAAWKTVTDNYDSDGDGSVDNAPWMVSLATNEQLAESFTAGDGGGLANGQSVELSLPGGGTWLQSPFEDINMTLMLTGGITRTVDVTYVGNGGNRFAVGDLNFDGDITADDWTIFQTGAEADLSGLSQVEAYRAGDLDGDFQNSTLDFGIFKDAFDGANGAGSFHAMLAGVPEPGTCGLIAIALALVAGLLRHRRAAMSVVVVAALSLTATAQAAIFEDFQFNDLDGTVLADAENSANPGNGWFAPNLLDSTVQDNVFRIQKSGEDFSTNFLQIANITSGTAWLIAEIAGWSFTPELGMDEDPEEIRFGFLNNDTGNSGSTITAQAQIQRGASGIELIGNSGVATDGIDDIAAVQPLNLVQNDPFTLVLEIDEDANMYSIYYREGAGGFNLLGTSTHDATRDGNSIRFGVNNSFSGDGEFFAIDRLYLTDEDPIVDVVDPLTLRVNTTTGEVSIVNNSSVAYAFDHYRITSPENALNFAGWDSLSDQEVDAVDGPDPGNTPGDGVGETWDEAGGASDSVLAESFLLGSSMLAPTEMFDLGNAFKTGGSENVGFQFRLAETGAVLDGLIEYVTGGGIDGDYNGDGVVNAADYVLWRNNEGQATTLLNQNPAAATPNLVDQEDYDFWVANFGNPGGSGATAAVPEPAAWLMAALCLALGAARRSFVAQGMRC